MYNSGELLWNARLMDPTSGQISRTFYRLADMIRFSRPSAQETLVEDYYILSTLLEVCAFVFVSQVSMFVDCSLH